MHNTNSLNHPLWTALVTPLTSSGHPDLESLEQLLREQEEAGNGVLLLGSTGEALNLSEAERKLVIDFSTSLDLKTSIMAGIGGHYLPDIISWIYFLETKKIDAYLMVTPLYSKPGPQGQYHWFNTLLDIATRPAMLYNIPSRTGSALHTDVVQRLRDHHNFWAVKEASGSVDEFIKYGSVCGDVVLYSGDDLMMPQFVPHGAVGVVSVAANVWPLATRRYAEMALQNELTEEDIGFWKEVSKSMFIASNPIPAKSVLCSEGRIRSSEVKPPLHCDDMTSVDLVCEISRQVNDWYRKRNRAGISIS